MSALADAVLASLWHGALVAGLVALIGAAWRASPRVRCGLATLGLWSIGAWFAIDVGLALADAVVLAPAASLPAIASSSPVSAQSLSRESLSPNSAWSIVGWLWALGVGVGGGRLGLAAWCLHRWRRRAAPVGDAVARRWTALAARMGVRRAPQFGISIDVDSPLVVGVLRPMVLVPATLLLGRAPAFDPAQLEALIAHELAHLRRGDPWANAAQVVIELLQFHNPFVWWLAAAARSTREHACDDLAVSATEDPMLVARALVALADVAHTPPQVPALAATGSPLRKRVERLVAARPAARPFTAGLVVLLVGALGWLSLSGLPRPVTSPDRLGVNGADRLPTPESSRPSQPDARRLGIPWLPESVRQHEAAIVAAGTRHGVDPDLLAIVTLLESRGDSDARSPQGARGLMQLMPATAAAGAQAQGLPPPTAARLADPSYNLHLGAWFLAQQLQTFGDDDAPQRQVIERAVAAYNAGPGRVRAWLDDGRALPEETSRYRARVGELWANRRAPAGRAPARG